MTPPPIDPLGYPAPPAYTEQEFDRKVSRAEQISLQEPPAPASGSESALTDEQWAEIEEAAFQAAIAASLAEATGSEPPRGGTEIQPGPPSPSRRRSPPSVQPLRIEKKNKPSVDLKDSKEHPKWLSEVEASSSHFQAGPSNQGAATHSFDGDEIAPPPFAEAAPSYSHREVAVIGYETPSHAQSQASSPALSPLPDLDALSISASISEQESSARRSPLPQPPTPHMESHPEPNVEAVGSQLFNSYPQPTYSTLPVPTNSYQLDQRPRNEVHPRQPPSPSPAAFSSQWNSPSMPSISAPLVQFNPSVAYGKSPYRRLQRTPPPMPAIDEPRQEVYRANAFYNSAVSAHLPSTPQRPAHDRTTVYSRPGHAPSYGHFSSNTPQPAYRTFGGASNMMESTYSSPSGPTSSWSSPYANTTNNRPLSTYSMDSVYSTASSNSNTQQHYPGNTLSQSQSGHAYGNWPPLTPDRQFTNYR